MNPNPPDTDPIALSTSADAPAPDPLPAAGHGLTSAAAEACVQAAPTAAGGGEPAQASDQPLEGEHPGTHTSAGVEPPAASQPPRAADLSPAACAAALAQHFPALFGAGVLLPVKLRIQADIQARAPGVFSRKALSLFLHRHTTSTPYIRALVASATRFDLDGQPAGAISEEHRSAAVTEMERRKALAQERRAAQRQQQRRGPDHASRPARAAPQALAPAGIEPAGESMPEGRVDAPGVGHPAAPLRNQRPPGGERPPQEQPPGAHRRDRHQAPRDAAQGRGPRPDQGSNRRSDGRRNGPPGVRPGDRPQQVPPAARPLPAAGQDDAAASALSSTGDPVADAARRERSALLRSFEGSTLTKANFLVLKRMTEADLDAQLALARQERKMATSGTPAGAAPREPHNARR